MIDYSIKTGVCQSCGGTEAKLHQQICSNGMRHLLWVCRRCSKRNPFGGPSYIARATVMLMPEQINDLPTIKPEPARRPESNQGTFNL